MTVIGPDGAQWSDGRPAVDGATISVGVRTGAPAGTYTVNYRATSADGHVVTGSWSYRVAPAAAAPQPAPAPTTPQTAAAPAAESTDAPADGPAGVAVRGGRHRGGRRRCRVGGPAQVVTHRRAVAGGVARHRRGMRAGLGAGPAARGVAGGPGQSGGRHRCRDHPRAGRGARAGRAALPCRAPAAGHRTAGRRLCPLAGAEVVRLVLDTATAAGTAPARVGLRTVGVFVTQTAAGRAGLVTILAAAGVCALAAAAPGPRRPRSSAPEWPRSASSAIP